MTTDKSDAVSAETARVFHPAYPGQRDIVANPYSPDEERVVRWMVATSGIGGGDDPIGFIMASLAFGTHQCNLYRDALKAILEVPDEVRSVNLAAKAIKGD